MITLITIICTLLGVLCFAGLVVFVTDDAEIVGAVTLMFVFLVLCILIIAGVSIKIYTGGIF